MNRTFEHTDTGERRRREMPVIRIEKNKNYTVMSNYHLRDKKLSLKAKGLISFMLSLPEDWDYSVEGLSKTSTDKETSIKSALKELERNNYLELKKIRNAKGQWESIYTIFETPKKPELIFHPGKSDVENQGQINTKNKILKKEKKKERKMSYNDYEQRTYTEEELKEIIKI